MKKNIATLFISLFFINTIHAAVVRVQNDPDGWKLLVDGQPFIVKGMAYTAEKIGESPDFATYRDWMVVDDNANGRIDGAYDTYVDVNRNNLKDANEPVVGDFQLMKEMGVNTIRVYHHPSNAAAVVPGYAGNASTLRQYNHAPNKILMRDLFNTYGIRVAIGDLIGAYTIGAGIAWPGPTDYRNAAQKAQIQKNVEQMVADFKDEPILMYVLGNENNYGSGTNTNADSFPIDYARFVDQLAQRIHQLDPNHPVAVCMGDVALLSQFNQYAPNVDIYGANVYREGSMGTFWSSIRSGYNKPVLLTEYGDYKNRVAAGGVMDETRQNTIHQNVWNSVVANTAGNTGADNAIGGFAYQFTDNWWQYRETGSNPSTHNFNTVVGSTNLEWQGLTSQGNGTKSPYLRQLRQIYNTYKNSLWTTPPQAVNDTMVLYEDEPKVLNPLVNDLNPSKLVLTLVSFTQGAHGSVRRFKSPTSSFLEYAPQTNYNGPDQFSYTMRDSANRTSSANVSVTVTPLNDAPVATNDVANCIDEEAARIYFSFNDGDVDASGNFPVFEDLDTSGTIGTISYLIDPQTTYPYFLYQPKSGYSGEDTFRYRINDGQGMNNLSNPATVLVRNVSTLQQGGGAIAIAAPPQAGNDLIGNNEEFPIEQLRHAQIRVLENLINNRNNIARVEVIAAQGGLLTTDIWRSDSPPQLVNHLDSLSLESKIAGILEWHGTDSSGALIANGAYTMRLKLNGSFLANVDVVVLR